MTKEDIDITTEVIITFEEKYCSQTCQFHSEEYFYCHLFCEDIVYNAGKWQRCKECLKSVNKQPTVVEGIVLIAGDGTLWIGDHLFRQNFYKLKGKNVKVTIEEIE